MKLSFHGAAQGVTGSCHLLQAGGLRILIDCGMFQGARHADEENAGDFGFEPSEIDFLLLTHAHLDHCGRIPLLVKRGSRRNDHHNSRDARTVKADHDGFSAYSGRRHRARLAS